MATDIDISPIVSDYFRPFKFGQGRRFSWGRFVLSVCLPFSLALVLSWRHHVIAEQYQMSILTVILFVAAAMVAMLPVVQYIVGTGIQNTPYTEAQYAVWRHQVARHQTSVGLYSSISWAVVLSVFSMVPLLLLQVPRLPATIKWISSVSIYFVGFSLAILFLEITSGVYLVLKAQAAEVDQRLKDSEPRERD
jgi:hypothetical protein